jgi:hypothetical protein
MPAPPNGPLREIALLIGLPITEEEFGARLADSDLLTRFRPTRLDAALDINSDEWRSRTRRSWVTHYLPTTATPVSELLEAAEMNGARAVTQATLSDFHDATTEFGKIILLSHWKGPEVSPDDIVRAAPREYFLRLDTQDSPVTLRLREKFLEHGLGDETCDRASSSRQARSTLQKVLNEIITEKAKFDQQKGRPVTEHPLTVETRRRDEIDAIFAGLLRPGNRLELFDGMHDKHHIETAIAIGFKGLIDLTTCTSSVVADYIGSRRDYQIRVVSFPITIPPEWSSLCVKVALELAAGGLPYLAARDKAISLIRDCIAQEERRRRRWPWRWFGG